MTAEHTETWWSRSSLFHWEGNKWAMWQLGPARSSRITESHCDCPGMKVPIPWEGKRNRSFCQGSGREEPWVLSAGSSLLSVCRLNFNTLISNYGPAEMKWFLHGVTGGVLMGYIRELHNPTEVRPEKRQLYTQECFCAWEPSPAPNSTCVTQCWEIPGAFHLCKPRKSELGKPQWPQRALLLLMSPARTAKRPENVIL